MLREHGTPGKSDYLVINEWSLADFTDVYTKERHPSNTTQHPAHTPREGESEWYGGLKTSEQARAILADGWAVGADRLRSILSEIKPPTSAKSRKRSTVWSDEGDDLRVDNAMRGDWDTAWRSSRRTWTTGPSTVEIYAMLGGSAYSTPEQLFWNGATACAIADMLESLGYSVAIIGCFSHLASGKHGDETGGLGCTQVTVKGTDETLRLDAVAGVLCHAGIFRTHFFEALMALPFALTSGLGPAVYHWTPEQIASMRAHGEISEHGIVMATCYTRDAAIAEVKRICALVSGTSEG